MRRSTLLPALALLSACATASPRPDTSPAETAPAAQAAPAADPFAGCTTVSTSAEGFVLRCGSRVASLDRATNATPEGVLESYFAGMKTTVRGDLRRAPVERTVGGESRRGISLDLFAEGQTTAAWSGVALSWADPDGTVRLVSCGAGIEADRALCDATFAALATADGVPAGVAQAEQPQVAGWPPEMPAGCSAGPQSGPTVFHAMCPETGANLVLMRLGDAAADASKFEETLTTLSNQTFEALKAGVSPEVTMETGRCRFAGTTDSACTAYVFPKQEEVTLVMLMAVGNAANSAVIVQCTFAMEMGQPAQCAPWVTLVE